MGTAYKKTPEIVKILMEELEHGLLQKYACHIAGITEQTAIEWKNNDPEFLNQFEAAKAVGIRRLQMKAEEQGHAWKILKNAARGDYTDEEAIALDVKIPDLSEVSKEAILDKLRKP